MVRLPAAAELAKRLPDEPVAAVYASRALLARSGGTDPRRCAGTQLTVPESPLHREDYLVRALRGGYPEAVRRVDLGRRARFFESYVSDLISRDVRQVSEIERPADMRRSLNLIAASMATLAVPAAFADHLRLPASTVNRYLDLLELLYVVRRIPAWSTNLSTRAAATPKLVVVDSGLAGHLTGMTLKRAKHPTSPVGSDHGEFRARRAGPAAELDQ